VELKFRFGAFWKTGVRAHNQSTSLVLNKKILAHIYRPRTKDIGPGVFF
jgi:hypothetical protein